MCKINLNNLLSENPEVKYGSAKKAIAISKKYPVGLYQSFDFFVKLLDNPNNILKWTALQVIGNLSKADKKGKVDKILPKIIGFLKAGKLITANNTILALSEIAVNKPRCANAITKELLKIEDYNFETSECRNIAIGKTLLAFDKLKQEIKDNTEALSFIKKQTNNSRNATKKKAQELMKKIVKLDKNKLAN